MIDEIFAESIAGWRLDPWAVDALFSKAESEQLSAARRAIKRDKRTIAYCVYENPFAKGGGILAVAKNLPPALADVNYQVVVISPLHRRLKTAPATPELESGSRSGSLLTPIAVTKVRFGRKRISTRIWEYRENRIRWVLFEAEGFFEASGGPSGTNPYDYASPETPRARSRLATDSLFASAAVPHVLQAIGITEDVVVHAQDWEMAATALTVKQAVLDGNLHSAAVVITSHNTYDAELSAGRRGSRSSTGDLSKITDRVADHQWPSLRAAEHHRRSTFYECMIPLSDAPLSTVSRNFARELTTDPLQTVHFAEHLQAVYARQRLVGVDNGLFMAPRQPFTSGAIAKAAAGDLSPLLAEKYQCRQRLLKHLALLLVGERPGGLFGRLDRWLTDSRHGGERLPDDVPIFMMFGRLDPAQKGFDLFSRAIEQIPRGEARFLISAIVSGAENRFTKDLQRLAKKRNADVLVFTGELPFFHEAMRGSSFCVMPSIYEPFGAATEPFLNGTPVLAHATGGLIQQVAAWNDDPARSTGFLYHSHFQSADDQQLGQQWGEILACADPRQRMDSPLYAALVEALGETILRACRLYRTDLAGYAQMLTNLRSQALKFSWAKAAEEYGALYDLACR